MTISTYHVESVIKAYSKQARLEKPAKSEAAPNIYEDTVTLSLENNREEILEKISYNLLDILLKKERPE